MITENNVSTLKIHKLTQAQYERELAAGRIDEYALYLTPEEEIDYDSFATQDDLKDKADKEHNHNDKYYTEAEIDSKLDDTKSYVDTAVTSKISLDQGVENADKILTTDSEGKVVAELTAWTMNNVIETLADTDLINILKIHDGSMLADTDGNVLSF